MRVFLVLLACAVFSSASAQSSSPLTLAQALAAAGEGHPDLRLAEAERAASAAEQDLAASRGDWNVNFEAGLRRVRPSTGGADLSDNSAKLAARKNLYDFGRTALSAQAAADVVAARDLSLLETRDRRRIEIMARFFDVLTADMQYTAASEYMAVAYVAFDNGRDRFKVGQISGADLAELEHGYQELRVKRNEAQARNRAARALLANAMNRPGQLARELEDPPLSGNNRPLPEFETLLPLLQEHSPRLRAQRSLLSAAAGRLESLRAETSPSLDAEVEAASYTRETVTRDNLKAGVVLTWPLYQGRRISAQIAREQAQFHRLQAETEKLSMDLTQALLETWLEIGELQRTVREAAKKQVAYRDLALEKARGLYELELRTHLGDAMAATMEAKLRERRTEYRLALAFARLEALLGRPLPEAEHQ